MSSPPPDTKGPAGHGGPIEPHLYLARHGESEWNAQRRITGQADSPLSELGRQQAKALAARLAPVPLAAIACSPLSRALETARAVAERQQITPHVEPAFREICFGVLEGRRRDGSDPAAEAGWALWRDSSGQQPASGGESFESLMLRVAAALPRWIAQAEQEPLLIVAHRNVNRAILANLLGWSPAAAFQQRISQRKLLKIRLGRQRSFSSDRFFTR